MQIQSLIIVLSGLALFACGPDPTFVRAPFAGVTNESVEQVMDAANGGILQVGNGTEIHVPANAFVDKEGQLVTGKVKVSYTEIDDPTSILVSGIPLNFGDKTNPSVMESAVMFDLKAMSNGQNLELKQGKSIRTIVSSNVEGGKYDFFRLDKEERTWDNLGSVEPSDNPAIDSLSNAIADLEASQEDFLLSDCFAFNYAYDLDIYLDEDREKLNDRRFNYYTWDTAPAVETLEKILRVKLESYGVPTFLKERSWEEITWKGEKHNPNLLLWKSEKPLPNWITKSKKYRNAGIKSLGKDRYLLTFTRWEYEGDKWKEFTDYSAIVSPKMKLETLYSSPPEQRSAEYEALLAQAEKEKETLAAQNKVLREFNISKMGVYNYDYIKEEERLLVNAEIYLDGAKLQDQMTDLFVMIKDRNAVLRYGKNGLDHFVIYPGQELFAFMVVEGNGIAYQVDDSLNDLDIASYRSNQEKRLKISLKSSDYVINRPIDLTDFLAKEMKGESSEGMISMK